MCLWRDFVSCAWHWNVDHTCSVHALAQHWHVDHIRSIHATYRGGAPRVGQGLGGEQTAYLQCIINTASIGQRLDESGVGVLISLHARAAE